MYCHALPLVCRASQRFTAACVLHCQPDRIRCSPQHDQGSPPAGPCSIPLPWSCPVPKANPLLNTRSLGNGSAVLLRPQVLGNGILSKGVGLGQGLNTGEHGMCDAIRKKSCSHHGGRACAGRGLQPLAELWKRVVVTSKYRNWNE